MDDGQESLEGVSESTERGLTLAGLLSFAVLVGLGCKPRLIVRLFCIHPAVSIIAVGVGIVMLALAFYGLGNALRLLRRGGRRPAPGEIDLGWGGAMGHYTEADEDPFGMPPGE